MRNFGTLALIVSLGFISPAIADPPTGEYNSNTPFVICDTRDQINVMVDALKANKLKEKLLEFGKIIDSNHEPECIYSRLGSFIFDSSESIGLVFDHEHAVNMWISSVHNKNLHFFLLWGEIGENSAT
jgi:hypothetical protein